MADPTTLSRLRMMTPYAIITVISAFYYSLYASVGFNTADDGNYAQIAYELFLGRAPAELAVNYGLAWFQIGATLFEWFGTDFDLVRGVFFGAITLTNLLIYGAVFRLTGHRLISAAAVAVPLLVPSFPATAFYGLCIMMNVAAQARLAAHLPSASVLDAGLAGLALSISYQFRPDFGYAFAIPLAITLVLTRNGRGAVVAASVFCAVLIPGLVAASLKGYGRELVDLYLSYPALMIEYLTAGLSGPSTATVNASTLLQRPPLSALVAGSPEAVFAWLVYLPIVGLIAFVAASLNEQRRETLAAAIVTLSAATAFPHYFLFRPDMSHLANFMPGYAVVAAVLVSKLLASPSPARRVGAVLIGIHIFVYGWVGITSDATGSIGVAVGKDQPFQAGNGIGVRVNAAELAHLTNIRNLIVEHSVPGDSIVCLPYCPGVAFMTERRMLLPEFYADDSFLTRSPDWLPRAIRTTRDARPPVVIVMDWAINATEISRFKNWAAPYMSMLDEIAARKIEMPGTTIYLIAAAP